MSGTGLFVCGTDTGVGKTYVSTLLIRELRRSGLRVAGMKPVASGASIVNGELINDDAMQLLQAANVQSAYATVNPYCFAPAVAPHLAAQELATSIDIDFIEQKYRQLASQAETVIVEGVGGWSVPINETQTMADIVSRLKLPVILVVGIRLGCINHALLTAQAITLSGNQFAGWIANVIEPDMAMLEASIDTLKQRLMAPCLAIVGYGTRQVDVDRSLLQKILQTV